jgi:hypothetical protein
MMAVSKLLGLVALGEIEVESVQPLLSNLGMDENAAALAAAEMTKFLVPFTEARKREDALISVESTEMTAMPPMTRPMENGPKPLVASPKVPPRNIIDLRKDQPAQ